MSNRSISLTDSLYEYMNDVSLREPPCCSPCARRPPG